MGFFASSSSLWYRAMPRSTLNPEEPEYVVIGATARDLILERGYNIPTTRATIDIDLGIEVEDWNQFKKLKDMLLATGRFTDTPHVLIPKYTGQKPANILRIC